MAAPKHAPEEFPLDCLRLVAAKVKELLADGVSPEDVLELVKDLETLECTLMLVAWLVGWVRRNQQDNDPPVFGLNEQERAMVLHECASLVYRLEGKPIVEGPVTDRIFAMLLAALLNRVKLWLVDNETSDWLVDLVDRLIDEVSRY